MKIGILGAGQLGRMIALAGIPLNCSFNFLDPVPHSPASVAGRQFSGGYEDYKLLDSFLNGVDVVTYEFENVSSTATQYLTQKVKVFPPSRALEITQDRIFEKKFFNRLDIATPRFYEINNKNELRKAAAENGFPCVLKTRRMGYDGKGQFALKNNAGLDAVIADIEIKDMILEDFVKFNRELSILAVRSVTGETAFYSLVENLHKEGILRLSKAPAEGITPQLQQEAESYAKKVLTELNYVGVLAIELFEIDGKLLANEMACRVHNSGHWTIEGAETSQFENHVRSITGMPLGSTACVGFSAMFNIIGQVPDVDSLLSIPGVHLHLYDKQPRPNRKIGHITFRCDEKSEFLRITDELRKYFPMAI
jgi:5-(carboxyamino)imidazole ribonucleotide synthase